MRIDDGVAMLEISSDVQGKPGTIYLSLLWDYDTVILVDAGYPGQLAAIREAMGNEGIPYDTLDRVVITHHDVDHMGSLKSILSDETSKKPELIAHVMEKPYIQGEQRPLKVTQLEAGLASLPPAMQEIYEKLNAFYQHGTVMVDRTVIDGEELPYCGGIEVIHTPGHTAGHICLYIRRSKTLIAGDALRVEGGQLVRTWEHANFANDLYVQSLAKLTQYKIETVICYHGGLYQDNADRRIAELAK